MSAHKLTRLERAVLRNVWYARMCCDGRTEAGRIATIGGCLNALARLRRYGLVCRDRYNLTNEGWQKLVAARP